MCKTYQCALVPVDTLLLVCLGVGETRDLTTLAAEETVQVRSDLVAFALLQVMALRASCLCQVRAGTKAEVANMEAGVRKRTLKSPAPFLASPKQENVRNNYFVKFVELTET
jgi:hypothetical protein